MKFEIRGVRAPAPEGDRRPGIRLAFGLASSTYERRTMTVACAGALWHRRQTPSQ